MSADTAGLPDARTGLRGVDADGRTVWLARSISRKLYRCGLCGGAIEVGDEHVLVRYAEPVDGYDHHHWHRRCAEDGLFGELRGVQRVPAREATGH
jgi:hypothetical protein